MLFIALYGGVSFDSSDCSSFCGSTLFANGSIANFDDSLVGRTGFGVYVTV